MYNNVPETITTDDKQLKLADLSPKTQALAQIYTKWSNELVDARLDADKLTLAIKGLELQLAESIKADTAPAEEAEAEAEASNNDNHGGTD